MAEETAGGERKPELTKLIETVITKVDGLASDVRTNSYTIDRLETKVDRLETKVDRLETKVDRVESDLKEIRSDVRTLSGQFNDVGVMAIKDNQRITNVETRVSVLETGVQ
jgi:outer membrane murein-binding lipoprotein Lpp